jgi:O-antigen/teichoic acid export membrane protein
VRDTNNYILKASLLITVFFLASIFLFPIRTLHEHRIEFLIASVAIYCTAFLTVNQFILQSLNHIRQSQLVEKLIKPFLLILFLVIAGKLAFRSDSILLIVIADIVLGVCCLILATLIVRTTHRFRSSPKKAPEKEDLKKKTFHFFCITMLTLLITKISMLLLPWFAPQKDIGIFNVSYRFADLVVYPFFLMHTVLPQLFARHAGADTRSNQSLYSESTILMMIFSLPLIALNIFAGRIFLGWFGPAFSGGYTALVLLSITQFLFSLFGPANTILMMQNKEKYSVICLIVQVVTLFVTSLLLMPTLGITGGAISMLVSCLVYNILLSVLAYRLSGVISPFFSFGKLFSR